jgi:LAO/AO transport system kinase
VGLSEEVLAGLPRAVGRALSVVERGGAEAERLLAELRGRAGVVRTLGITGAPGVGKSTLVQTLGLQLLERGDRVAVLAVDPSSPFTGGALLGDRVRMPDLSARGAFVRSMATRGALGGVAAATADALDVLAAAGYGWVVVETVGVGQDEVDVAGVVDTVVVVTVAGLGDEVQAAKAGLLEIAHVFAVNKADRPGADGEVAALESMLAMAPEAAWAPPVLPLSAMTGEGIAELLDAVAAHQAHLDADGRRAALRRGRAERRIARVLEDLVWRRVRGGESRLALAVDEVAAGTLSPHDAARRLLAAMILEDA